MRNDCWAVPVRDVASVECGEPVSFRRGHATISGQFGGFHDGQVIVLTFAHSMRVPVGEVLDSQGRQLGVPSEDLTGDPPERE